jgi:hypothetical protein
MNKNIPNNLSKLLNNPFRTDWNEKNVGVLKDAFGSPPFKFHRNDNINASSLPPKVRRKKKYFNTLQTPEKLKQSPGPNWFGLNDCEFISSDGTEYKIAQESVQSEYLSQYGYKQGQVEDAFKKMSSYWEMKEEERRRELTTLKRVVLYVRGMKSKQTMQPPKDGTKLTLTLKKVQIECACTVEFTGIVRTAKSGYLIVSNLSVTGPVK